jgi:hypothetical protein
MSLDVQSILMFDVCRASFAASSAERAAGLALTSDKNHFAPHDILPSTTGADQVDIQLYD